MSFFFYCSMNNHTKPPIIIKAGTDKKIILEANIIVFSCIQSPTLIGS